MITEEEIIKLQHISLKLGIDFQKVKSWFLSASGFRFGEEERFFSENKYIQNVKPIIKWVGGKRQLLDQFELLFPKEFNNYFEPFLGGGSVFFHLQREKSYLSDLNEELINLYQVVKDSPNELIEVLENEEASRERFLQIRSWDRQENWKEKFSKIQRAMRFVYLNRTCFNGLYRVNSKGEFNVPFGKYINPNIVQKENILNASKLLNKTKAEIKLQGFEDILENVKKGDFVYLDPPYDVLSQSSNFTSYNESGFGRDMQIRLMNFFVELDKKGAFVMLSNHNTNFIQEIYDGFRMEIVKARRNINSKAEGRGKIDEIVILNY